MTEVLPVSVPPREAIEFFQRKGYQLTFDWRDLLRDAHARAFTVAKVARIDILQDIRAAVDRALVNGTTLRQFEQELTPLLQRKGWWGRTTMRDPLTGETKEVQLGSARRLFTIYDTNLRMSLAAGQWQRIEQTKQRRPYLRYLHMDSAHPRPEHASWHGLILRADDPWWSTHFPPNGWGCHCAVQQLGDRDLERQGLSVGEAPPLSLVEWQNTRTGQVEQVPGGIDPGFDYNPGAAGRAHLEQVLEQKLAGVPSEFREALQ